LITGNKRGRVDEHKHKEEGQSGVTPSSESILANPIQEQANLVELQTNPVEVEDNAGTSLSSDSAYIEQCDLINHIPRVSLYDLTFFLANTRQNNRDVF